MSGRAGWVRAATIFGYTLLVVALGFAYPLLSRGTELLSANYQSPWMLLGLVVLPFVFWRGIWGEDRRMPRLKLGTLSPLAVGPAGVRVWLRDLPGVMRSVALGLFVLSLARPVDTLHPQAADEEGIDIIISLDMSGSMKAVLDNVPEDLRRYIPPQPRAIRPTRLDAAKAVVRDFISRRKSDRIGMVVFGSSAYVLSPPTLDYQLLDALVSKMDLNLIDASGTAIGDGVGVGVARLRKSTAKSKALILLTDGDNNRGKLSPEYAAHLANSVGVKLFTVQIGQGDAAEVQDGVDLFGQPRYVPQSFPVNPELLKKLASDTGGAMYVATDAKTLQASFHDVLNKLEKTKLEASVATFEDLFGYYLLPGVLLLTVELLLRALVLRRFP
ncbi:MAG: VWA domain-containing protein [Myxococcota bacterium]